MEKKNSTIRTLFMGSPAYASTILHALHQAKLNVVGVVTQPDKPVGRGRKLQSPPVKIIAEDLGITCLQPAELRTQEFRLFLSDLAPEIIIVAAYGKILRNDVLDLPKFGCVNVHASLLPRWRGASPVHAAILHGDPKTGVTIMKMDTGIDTGAIISQKSLELADNETTGTLTDRLADLGAALLVETLPQYLDGSISPRPQNDENATYAGLIKKSDGLIDFQKSAAEIERRVRAMHPWPNAYFEWNGKTVKLFSIKILDSNTLSPAKRGKSQKYPIVGTGTNDIMLLELQMPGKKRFNGKVFLNGARDW